jgi:peptidoglycan/LPS O-acetylase OafA/YrhL
VTEPVVTTKSAPLAPTRRRLGRIPALDGLRGIAVLVVVVEHIETILIPGKVKIDAGPFHGAFLGVDIFFVLSGFLITGLLLGEQFDRTRVRLGAFYQRRALRLLPALYVLLIVHICYTFITGLSLHLEWLSVRAALVYLTNWAWKWDGLKAAPGLGHLWSLSVEEQFYVVWPALLIAFFGLRRRSTFVVTVMTAAIIAIALHRAVMWQHGTNWYFLFQRTDTRADSLLIGALFAQLWVRGWNPRWVARWAWIAAAILAYTITVARSTHAFLYLGGFTLVALCTGVVIIAAADGRWGGTRVLCFAPLRAVGQVSYGLYLWHMPVFYVMNRYGSGWGAPVRILVGLPVAAALTVASWVLVERPILRFKDRSRLARIDAPVAS